MLEELSLSLLLVTLLPRKVLVASNLINLLGINASQIDLVGSSNNVTRVDSSQRDTVNLEGTSNEKDSLWEVLQEDDALATETTSKEDENGTGGERWAGSRGADRLANLNIKISMCVELCVDLRSCRLRYFQLPSQHPRSGRRSNNRNTSSSASCKPNRTNLLC